MTHAKRLVALTVALALVTPGFANAPRQDAEPDRAAIEAREAAIFPTAVREIRSPSGIVAGTASPIAVEAGARVLREGGTAADAAATTALAQVTTMLGANVSAAGVLQLVYYEARTGRVHVLDAGWGSWRGDRSPATIPDTDLSLVTGHAAPNAIVGPAGRKMLIPGFMAGIEAMHRRFGRLPFRRLFDPAIWYAENGVPVTGLLAAYFSMGTAKLMQTPEGRRFAQPDGAAFPKLGERYRQPDLARLFRSVAAGGAREMYRGGWARDYVAAVRAAGGHATIEEMRAYAPRWGTPLTTAFDGATVAGPDAGNTSACATLEALNLIGHSRPEGEAEAFRTTALALRVAIFSHYGPAAAAIEKAAGVGGNCAGRTTPAYGAAIAPAMEAMLGGNVDPADPGHHSASIVAVDRWGNVAAIVHSSNTAIWGDSGMVVGGVPLPVPAAVYRHLLVNLAPGAHVPSDMVPVIILEGGRPVFAVATIGSSVVPETVRLVAALRRRAGLVDAISAPPLLLNYEDQSMPLFAREEYVPAGRYAPQLLDLVRGRGLRIREVDAQRTLYVRGTAAVAAIGPGERRGAEVPGVLAFAAAE